MSYDSGLTVVSKNIGIDETITETQQYTLIPHIHHEVFSHTAGEIFLQANIMFYEHAAQPRHFFFFFCYTLTSFSVISDP